MSTQELPRADSVPQERPASEISASWKRGMRHAVERLDRVTGNGKPLPRKAADLTAMLLAVRDELDAITLFNGHHAPLSYEEAFRLSEDELARRFATTQDPTQ